LVAEDAVDEALINEMNDHMPTIVVKGDRLLDVARVFKTHPTLDCSYLRNVSGIDYETHLEVVYHLVSLATRHEYALKVKTDREAPQIPSVVSLWATANWNEREIFDLLGIGFTGHPDLRRIMMPDDWVGHPLRKDYEPLDPEV
ncbi:NADH-quinone oxidoreductase subunit C, partial [Paenibacillus sepulcri]|nr:NADH-quinone oxidoreductase subunit C [Paenibacillus sepulcri]